MTTTPEYGVFIDWNKDGDFDEAGEDVTERVKARSPMTIQYGRDQARSLAPIQPGQAIFELDNRSNDYSPENASSPLAGNLRAGRPVLIKATLDSTEYMLYRGFLDDYRVLPDITDQAVEFTALDALARFREVKLSTDLYHGITTGQAIGYILDAIGWPTADRDLDNGVTTIRWWWEEGTDAFAALTSVVDSEGPGSLVTVGTDGTFVFRDRHSRLTDPASLTSQVTFSAVDCTEPAIAPPLDYDVGWRDIVNSVSISVEDRVPTPSPVNVFETEQLYTVASGSAISIAVETTDPFMRATPPVAGTDFTLLSGTVEVTLSRASGAATIILVRAIGGNATIEGMRLRAYSVAVASTFQVVQEDVVSISDYGRRSYPGDARWAGVHDALAIAQIVLAHRAESRAVVSIRLTGAHQARLEQQLSRDLSDRVTIVEPSMGLDADFFIEQIKHSIAGGDGYFETIFGCEKAPVPVANPFTFGVAGRGFDEGQFGQAGFSNPDTMFRFNVAGQGFNDGLFAF